MNGHDLAGPGVDLLCARIPPTAGSYALLLLLPQPARIAVGRLGEIDFSPGSYLYLGSAFGPGGLRARIRHHLSSASRPHWHMDHLRRLASLAGGWYSTAPERLECAWSQSLASHPGATIPAPRFGSSDCRRGCRSHLVALPENHSLNSIQDLLSACTPSILAPIEPHPLQ